MQFSIATFQQRDLLDQGFIDRFDRLQILTHNLDLLDRVDRDTHPLWTSWANVGLDGMQILLHRQDLRVQFLWAWVDGIDEII